MNDKWFKLQIEQIEKKLKTNAASGLSRKAARSRIDRTAGSLFYIPRKSPLSLLMDLLSDFSLILLLLAAIVSLFFEEFRSGMTVLILTAGNLIVAWWFYYRGKRTEEVLHSCFYPIVKVIRNGKLFHVDFRSVVTGDVILVEEGDVICCDARLVNSDGLRVRMRLDRERFVSLEKMAEGHVRPNEFRAEEMVNMIHAGSIVEKGSARAIVTAVGTYTYLGAMTGGIVSPFSEKAPGVLKRLKKNFSKLNMIFLLAVLPFSLISLLFSHLDGGTVLLSSAFLVALSIVATTASQMTVTLFRLFYTYQIRRLMSAPHAAVFRSVEAFDKLADADYVFLLDGCVLTDGILHFQDAVCAEGEIRNYRTLTPSAKCFSEQVALYHAAATRTLTTGVSGAGNYFKAMEEFVRKSGVDEGALRIRCSILSYSVGNLETSAEMVCFTDQGRPFTLHVSRSLTLLRSCEFAMIGGVRQPLSIEGIQRLEQIWNHYETSDQCPIFFSLSEGQMSAAHACFVGMLSLREGVDPNLTRNVSRLEKLGCRVIAFHRNLSDAPTIPKQGFAARCFAKKEFVSHMVPLTEQFGKIRMYSEFNEEDILQLIECAHSQGKRVIAVGFTEDAFRIAQKADSFITCAPVHSSPIGYLDEEIHTKEVAGHQNSLSCTQTVKERADCLIPRPSGGKGGLASLTLAVTSVQTVYRNLSDFLRYMVCTQLIRLLTVAIPILLGKEALDARHIVLFGCVMDLFAFFIFMGKKQGVRRSSFKRYDQCTTMRSFFRGDPILLIAALSASGALLILPELFGWIALDGLYHDKAEISLIGIVLLHLCALVFIYLDGVSDQKIYRNQLLILDVALSVLFLLLCFVWSEFGAVFGVESVPSLSYFAFALLPSALFSFLMAFLPKRMKKRRA